MAKRYQVVGECAHVVVTDVSGVSAMTLLYKGAFLPDGVDVVRLQHLLDSKLVAEAGEVPVAPNAAVDQDPRVGIPPVVADPDAETKPNDDGLHPAPPTDEQREEQRKAADAEAEMGRKRAAAQAKLPADGAPPHHNAAHEVWVEYAVVKGMDRGEAEKASKEDLRAALAQR